MTTRVEFKNTHTNRNPLRVRGLVKDGESFRLDSADGSPDLVLAPGQGGARRAETRFLLVEVLEEDYLSKQPVPTEA